MKLEEMKKKKIIFFKQSENDGKEPKRTKSMIRNLPLTTKFSISIELSTNSYIYIHIHAL